jgi:hypothetical protein
MGRKMRAAQDHPSKAQESATLAKTRQACLVRGLYVCGVKMSNTAHRQHANGDKAMKTRTKLIILAPLLTMLATPASARIDGDESGASAYPRFAKEHRQTSDFRFPSYDLINRPFQQR